MGFASTMDMYRKVPADLLEGTKRGSFCSLCAVFFMVVLFFYETVAFFESEHYTQIRLDDNSDSKLRVNFNVTMLDLACEYTVVDVVSFLGTEQNVTAHVNKWSLDANGLRSSYKGRNKNQNDILFSDETIVETIEELHENGEQAENLVKSTFKNYLKQNRYVFVDFFAPWCSHCNKMAPTWETLAELMHSAAEDIVQRQIAEHYPDGDHGFTEEDYHEAVNLTKPVMIGKVDCTTQKDLCEEYKITAYPSMKLFVGGEFHSDYKRDRTVLAFTHYLTSVEKDIEKDDHGSQNEDKDSSSLNDVHEQAKITAPEHHHQRIVHVERLKREWKIEEHPGCQIAGFLQLDRVPGNFHIMARSSSKDLVPSLTNVSHIVHDLSFGDPMMIKRATKLGNLPPDYSLNYGNMKDNAYVTKNPHNAYHHHIKVVTSTLSSQNSARLGAKFYQMLVQSSVTATRKFEVPEARFVYDLAPVMIEFNQRYRGFYDYLTSILAIVGGTFTVFGMLEASLGVASMGRTR